MKKGNYLLAMTIFCMALVSSQNMMAKKLVYLGHNYDGKVKNKAPEGEGEIIIGGLFVMGTFHGNTVTDAMVRLDGDLFPNVAFEGTVVFNESDNITLKAGGNICTYYYENKSISTSIDKLISDERKFISKTQVEDCTVSASDPVFNPTEIKIPYRAKLYNDIPEGLNPPKEVISYFTIGLSEVDIEYWFEYNIYKKERKKIKSFVYNYFDYYRDGIIKSFNVNNYKDNEGRIWSISKSYQSNFSFEVIYPGGSKFSRNGQTSDFELHYPDGKVIKPINKDADNFIKINDDVWVRVDRGGDDYLKIFLENVKQDHFVMIPTPYATMYVYSESLDIINMTEQDIELFFKEKVFPFYKDIQSNNASFELLNKLSYSRENIIAAYNHGKVGIKAKGAAKANEDLRKEYSENVARLKKAYGAKYVDAAMKGQLLVGMPLDLLSDTEFWYDYTNNYKLQPYMSYYAWSVFKHNTTLGVYRIQRQHKTTGKLAHFKVWVRNGKITEIYND